MANLAWDVQRNLENSFIDYIQAQIDLVSLTIPDTNGNAQAVSARVGFEFNSSWTLPIISAYVDSNTKPRLSIGSNKRQKAYLIIIDIRSLDKGSQLDLTDWLQDAINDGFVFNEYTPNPGDPLNPTIVVNGRVSIDFISNIPLRLGENVELFDKYRQNITLSCIISNS